MAGHYPTVYEADLPTVSHEDASTPESAHTPLEEARRQFPDGLEAQASRQEHRWIGSTR